MNKVKLGNIARYSDERFNSSELSLENYIGTDNLLQNKLGKTVSLYVPKKGHTTGYKKGDILVANIRPYLKKIWFANIEGGSSSDVSVIRIVDPNYSSRYVYYSLFQDAFFNFAMQGSKGSKMPRLDKKRILDYPIINYDLSTQKTISAILSSIDSKIEINNKTNAELEVMAKLIYDYWFVQFDFPDVSGKPYKTSGGKMVWSEELKREIPVGWEVKKISDLLPVLTGKQDANFASSNGKYNFFTCGEEILKCNSFEFEGKSVLVAGNGNFNIKLYEGKFNAYQRTYVLIPEDEKYYTVVYLAVKDRIASLSKGSRGSIVKFITKGDLEDIQIPLPKEKNLDLFSVLNIITKKIENKLEENQKLAELRDWLLPMLMNGQVKIRG